LNFPDPMGSIKIFEGVSVEIKANGLIWRVVDHYSDWPTKSGQLARIRFSLTKD
jgi:hypothetical protein